MKYQSLIVASLFVCSSMAFAQDYEDIAEEACDCVSDAYGKMEEMKLVVAEAIKTGDMSKVMMAQGEMMQHMGAVNICFGKLTEKYPDIANNPEQRKEVEAIMVKECPRPEFDIPGMTQ